MRYTKGKHGRVPVDTMTEEIICCICRETEIDFTTTCKHTYHKACFDIWFEQHDTCPYCNARQPDIFTAIESDDLEYFKVCLELGQAEKIDGQENDERPVHRCARLDRIQMLTLLLPRVQIDSENYERQTGMMVAVEQENVDATKLFIEHGANLDKLTDEEKGWVMNQIEDEESWSRVFDMMFATLECIHHLLPSDRDQIIKPVLTRFSVLQAIESKMDLGHIKQLIEKGALVSSSRLCEMVFAIKSGSPELVAYFVELGVDVNSCKPNSKSNLVYAVELEDLEVVRTFIELGADVTHEIERDYACNLTVLDFAAAIDNLAIFELLVTLGARSGNIDGENSALRVACTLGKFDMVKCLVEAGADPTDKNGGRHNMIDIAASCQDHGILEYLLGFSEATDRILSETKEDYLKAATLAAINSQSLNSMNILLQNGANVNSVHLYNMTSLMMAVRGRSYEMVMLLIESGAELNAVSWQGRTALHMAASRRSPEITRYLIEKGANLDIQDSEGNTALQLARDRNYQEIVILIEDAEKAKEMIKDHIWEPDLGESSEEENVAHQPKKVRVENDSP